MTAASGDPGEAPQNGGATPDLPAYETPPDPAYGLPGVPVYGTYPPPPPPPQPPPSPGYAPPAYGPPYQGGYPDYPGHPGHPGYPGYPGYPPPQRTGTNTLAIVALTSSVLGLLCGLGSLLGIALGLVAVNQIKRTGQQGYALAVSAIVVGVATLLLSIIMWTYAQNMA